MDVIDEDDVVEGKSVSMIGPNIAINGNIEATGNPTWPTSRWRAASPATYAARP